MHASAGLPARGFAIALVAFISVSLAVAFEWNEQSLGSLSDFGWQPTVLEPEMGDNNIYASVSGENELTDSDFFTFLIPEDWELISITLTSFTDPNDTTFIGIEDTPVYFTGQGNPYYYGFTFMSQALVGQDLLPALGASNGNFTPPLGYGAYSFWINESSTARNYSLNLRFIMVGDINCDGVVDFADINPFVDALTNPDVYAAMYPDCPVENGDFDGDGQIGFSDINAFVDLMLSIQVE